MGSLFKREKIDITGKTNNIYLSTFLFDNLIQTPFSKIHHSKFIGILWGILGGYI